MSLSKRSLSMWIFISIIGLCAFVNDGFMGTDEYWVGITRYLPAQETSPSGFLRPEDVKSPLQMIPYWVVARGAWSMGVDDPYIQYRIMLVILGLVSAGLIAWGLVRAQTLRGFSGTPISFYFSVFSFFFFMPFILTRPMFETLTIPWLFLAGIFALSYHERLAMRDLALGVFFASLAFMLRPQVGLCSLIFPFLALYHRRWKDFGLTAGLGALFFIIIGYFDGLLVGRFHGSLLANIEYNFAHGHEYGNQSFLVYPALLFVLGLIPWLLFRGSSLLQKSYWKNHWILWVVIGLFVFTHSLISQKFERFLIPILPLYTLVLIPVYFQLWQLRRERRLRVFSLIGFSFLLWILANWFAPQKNIIELARYLKNHPEIKNLVLIENIPDWIPEIFADRKDFKVINTPIDSLPTECTRDTAIAAAMSFATRIPESWKQIITYNSNPLDGLAYKINPEKNLRRSPISIYECK